MLVENTLFGEINKEKIAIERCIEFQNRNANKKNILAFSGGKDSLAAYLILVQSGVKFTPIYSPTSVDPPELIYYIKDEFNCWADAHGYPEVTIQPYKKYNSRRAKGKMEGKEITMWTLIRNRALPPTRRMRYCCDELKERTGEEGDTIFNGVRAEESDSRSKMPMINFYKGKIMARIIIDWLEEDVWEIIHKYNIPYCCKYDEGWKRIGCIGCPLGSGQAKELGEYPKFKEAYIRAFDDMLNYRKENGMETEWKTGEEVYKWWIGECTKQNRVVKGQCSMF